MDAVLAPDIYVNASVALGSPPEHVVRRAFSARRKPKTSTWVMERVRSMLHALPEFKDEAVERQMETIRGLVEIVENREHYIEDWSEALVALAKAAGVGRVLTDHPDLLGSNDAEGIEFVSSERWLVEQATPPPPPVV
ncbi:MAG: hypothetical protein JRE81_04530 [Deltaproteobacteria bacterium]|jgi:hypothetical protein|nr:hypothetical protein [Deltaproteobacteria bacterium]